MLIGIVSAWGADRSININEITLNIDESGGTGIFTLEETVNGATITSFPANCGLVGNVLTCDSDSPSERTIIYQTSGSGTVSGEIVGGFPSTSKIITGDTQIGVSPPGSANIEINEFESNPASGDEWIELYNPNAFNVDISGWKIYDGLASESLIYTVPASTVINANDYYAFDLTSTVLNNDDEFITLKDDSDVQIDQTPTLADTSGDDNTWQRVPDGIDNWIFKEETKDATNDGASTEDNDLMVNYIRGKILLDTLPAVAGTQYKVEVLSGANSGYIYYGQVDENIPTTPTDLTGMGFFDTLDQAEFSTGDLFRVSLIDYVCNTTGTFENGGNGWFEPETDLIVLDCTIPNVAPVLDSIGNKEVNESQELSFTVNATDLNGDGLTYSANDLPAGASFVNQLFNWTPNYTQAGDYDVEFVVEDAEFNDTETITITVNNVNRAPILDAAIPDQIWDEDTTREINLSMYFSDPDGETLTYTASILENITVTINSPAILDPNENWFGVENVIFTASDGDLTEDSNSVQLTVNAVNDAPVLDPIADVEVEETELVEILTSATDIENDALTFSINDTRFTQNGSNFTWLTAFGDEGIFLVNISVSDGLLEDSQIVQITINDKNEPPIFDPIPDINILEDSGFTDGFVLSAVDNDGTIQIFRVIDEDTNKVDCIVSDAILGVTPFENWFGTVNCTIEVEDDRGATDEQTVKINVTNVNDAPTIDSYSPTYDPIITEDGTQAFSISWTDIDNTPAQVVVKWFVDGIEAFIGENYNFNALGNGDYEIKAIVNDTELQDEQVWNLRATNVPIVDTYNGNTTNFTGMNDTDLEFVWLILEKLPFGRIEWLQPVDLRDAVDFDNNADIQQGLAALDSDYFPTLKGIPARVTLYNLGFAKTPTIYYDNGFTLNRNSINQVCPVGTCTNTTYQNGTLSFLTTFSSFKIGDTLSCSEKGGDICKSNEVCNSDFMEALEDRCCPTKCIPTFGDVDLCESIDEDLEIQIREPDENDDFDIGEDIEIDVKVKNKFDEEIDVDLYVYLYDVTEDEELEDLDESFSLDENEDERIEFNIPVPDYIDEDNEYVIFVRAEGENDEDYCNQEHVYIDLERKRHDVVISRFDIPPLVNCGDTAIAEIFVENRGEKAEDMKIELRSNSLGIFEQTEEFELEEYDEDNKASKIFLLQIPEDKDGIYSFEARAEFSDTDTVTKEVIVECEKPLTIPISDISLDKLETKPVTKTTRTSSWKLTDCGMVFLVVLDIFLVIGIIFLIVFLASRRY